MLSNYLPALSQQAGGGYILTWKGVGRNEEGIYTYAKSRKETRDLTKRIKLLATRRWRTIKVGQSTEGPAGDFEGEIVRSGATRKPSSIAPLASNYTLHAAILVGGCQMQTISVQAAS